MKKNIKILSRGLLVFLLLICLGCAPKPPLSKGRFITPLTELRHFEGTSLFYHLNPDTVLSLQDTRVIKIEPVTLKGELVTAPEHSIMRRYVPLLEERLYYNLVRLLCPPLIIADTTDSIDAYSELGYQTLFLQVDVIEVKYGCGFLRYFVGYGVGGVLVHIEGRILRPDDGSSVGEFIIRKRHSGNPFGGLNVKVISTKYCLRDALDHVAEDITRFMKAVVIPE